MFNFVQKPFSSLKIGLHLRYKKWHKKRKIKIIVKTITVFVSVGISNGQKKSYSVCRTGPVHPVRTLIRCSKWTGLFFVYLRVFFFEFFSNANAFSTSVRLTCRVRTSRPRARSKHNIITICNPNSGSQKVPESTQWRSSRSSTMRTRVVYVLLLLFTKTLSSFPHTGVNLIIRI